MFQVLFAYFSMRIQSVKLKHKPADKRLCTFPVHSTGKPRGFFSHLLCICRVSSLFVSFFVDSFFVKDVLDDL